MKKAVLASVVAAVMSGSVMAAEIYNSDGTSLKIGGRAEARFNVSDNNEVDGNSSFEDKSRARLNIKGKTKVSDELYGFGKYEAEFDGKSDLTNRYFFAGIGTNFGEFSYGKQDSAQVMLTDFTDTMATFGAASDDAIGDAIAGGKDKRTNNFLYSGEFNNLTIQANYLANDEKDTDSYGIAAMYSFGSFDLGAGYVYQDIDADTDANLFNIAGQFKLDAFTLGALVQLASGDDDDVTAYELSAQYKPMKQLTLVAVYNYAELDPSSGSKEDVVDEIAIEAVYKFNSHIRTYAGYKFQQIDDSDDELQAGIRYDF
ncbi:porin [Vibrio hippocampi]|uniref:Porin-like protein L n=1 Tax=Vibrio hippocampi TaxID=654686 RepID=A0ABN8DLJ0_9VIBR|nr:porin [Vibrio hippocampi]CAH0528984.1 Porin-like protein L [Vibrio hippocampi]